MSEDPPPQLYCREPWSGIPSLRMLKERERGVRNEPTLLKGKTDPCDTDEETASRDEDEPLPKTHDVDGTKTPKPRRKLRKNILSRLGGGGKAQPQQTQVPVQAPGPTTDTPRRGSAPDSEDWLDWPLPGAPKTISSVSSQTSTPPRSTEFLVPRSALNPNKPLPTPPSTAGVGQAARQYTPSPVLKLERIMATLSSSDVEKLFSGAPQYFARSEGHFTGAPHPSVAFPWDEELEIRDLTDHVQIEDVAWGCATAWPHITRDANRDASAAATAVEKKKRAHFYPRCRERPSMLSMQGLEKGTLGYQAALEMAVADSLQDEQWGFDSLGAKAQPVIERRQLLLASKDGLRHLDETAILEHLIKNGQRYSEKHHPREHRASIELYNELFLQILHPPTRVLDHNDPYSLSVQIQALVKVLAAPNVWIDFSLVEWRIRLGQILWGSPLPDKVEDGSSIKESDSVGDLCEERYWVLLHILLACELLVRLDAITEGDELGGANVKSSEIHKFEKDANNSVKWSLHLARAWLENIEVVKKEAASVEHLEKTNKPAGWLATLTKRMSLSHEQHGAPSPSHHHHHLLHHHRDPVYAMRGRHVQRQTEGLTHFAKILRWPDIESYASQISDNCRAITEGTPLSTPLATPATGTSQKSSYFGDAKVEPVPGVTTQAPARRRKVSAALHPSGWLSKSYVSGLMLPGEALSHFLMSTLLENDHDAIARLGPMANLCGGFVYSGKSFWSTACIVGRVLAAGRGAAECMGWISSVVSPRGLDERWLNVEVEEIPEDVQRVNKRARLWGKATIERESSVLGDGEQSSVLPADFIVPYETVYPESPPKNVRIALSALELLVAPDAKQQSIPAEDMELDLPTNSSKSLAILSGKATLSFAVAYHNNNEEYRFNLRTDVYFVTAHPCVPSQHVKILKSPSSPTIQQIDTSGNGITGKPSSPVHMTGHPLHKYYTYAAIHLTTLLRKRDLTLEQLLANYSPASYKSSFASTQVSASNKTAKCLVIDCISGFAQLPQESDIQLSLLASRPESRSPPSRSGPGSEAAAANFAAASGRVGDDRAVETAEKKMHGETRRRQFGSDMEILVRALCAERGWNALISRRRRGCLACAIREAGALGWKVVIRVE